MKVNLGVQDYLAVTVYGDQVSVTVTTSPPPRTCTFGVINPLRVIGCCCVVESKQLALHLSNKGDVNELNCLPAPTE